jgi:hypothetical protein
MIKPWLAFIKENINNSQLSKVTVDKHVYIYINDDFWVANNNVIGNDDISWNGGDLGKFDIDASYKG